MAARSHIYVLGLVEPLVEEHLQGKLVVALLPLPLCPAGGGLGNC